MKTTHLFSIALILFFIGHTTHLGAQNSFDSDIDFQELTIPSETIDLRTYEVNLDEGINYDFADAPKSITQNEAQVKAIAFAMNMLAFGVGFGFSEFETLWCLHAEYYMRLALIKSAAMYGSLGIGYNGISADNFNTNIIDFTLKLLMFSVLAKRFQQVRGLYGIFAKYGFGSNKFNDGFKTDLTTFSAGVVLGLHILLTLQWSLMIQTNVFTYQEQTNKFEGNESKSNSTFGFINKNNLLALSLIFTFGG